MELIDIRNRHEKNVMNTYGNVVKTFGNIRKTYGRRDENIFFYITQVYLRN